MFVWEISLGTHAICCSIVHRQPRGQKWLLCSPLGPAQLQLSSIVTFQLSTHSVSQSHCHGVVLSCIHGYVKKPHNFLFLHPSSCIFKICGLIQPADVGGARQDFMEVSIQCAQTLLASTGSAALKPGAQDSVQLTGRSVFTTSVRFVKGRMHINSSFSKYLLL